MHPPAVLTSLLIRDPRAHLLQYVYGADTQCQPAAARLSLAQERPRERGCQARMRHTCVQPAGSWSVMYCTGYGAALSLSPPP